MRLRKQIVPLLAITLLACGSADESPPSTPAPAPKEAAPEPVPVEPAPAPTPAPTGGNDMTTAEVGKMSYTVLCASCHGENGAADTPMAQALDPRPTAHNDGTTMNALSDDYLFKVIKEGGASVGKSPLMAPWGGSLSDDQILGVVAYIRTLADPPYPGNN